MRTRRRLAPTSSAARVSRPQGGSPGAESGAAVSSTSALMMPELSPYQPGTAVLGGPASCTPRKRRVAPGGTWKICASPAPVPVRPSPTKKLCRSPGARDAKPMSGMTSGPGGDRWARCRRERPRPGSARVRWSCRRSRPNCCSARCPRSRSCQRRWWGSRVRSRCSPRRTTVGRFGWIPWEARPASAERPLRSRQEPEGRHAPRRRCWRWPGR